MLKHTCCNIVTGKKHLKKQKQHGVTHDDLFCPLCQCAVTDLTAMETHLQGTRVVFVIFMNIEI